MHAIDRPQQNQHNHDHNKNDDHDQGLAHDLDLLTRRFTRRRQALRWLTGAGTMTLLGCGAGGSDSSVAGDTTGGTTSAASTTGTTAAGTTATATTTTGTTAANTATTGTTTATSTATSTTTGTTSSGTPSSNTGSCSVIPEETAGPYPGDGSNTANGSVANALALSGIVRSDIRASFAGATGTAAGVPLTVTLTLVNTNGSCADLQGYAVYLWHCDREGRYSMYSLGVTEQNYLRGVQVSASDETVTFTTIFPACYSGRMPHIHFEVYRNAAAISSASNKIKTSQLALPTDICSTVYQTATGYSASVTNLNQISFATDNVFSDGVTTQMATVTGSVSQGYVATLTVGVPA